MYRERLTIGIVVLLIYMLRFYPLQTITVAVVLGVAYLILRNVGVNSGLKNGEKIRRLAALKEARIYLAPYKDIWRSLKLSNKYCDLLLGVDGKTIRAKEKVFPYRSLKVLKSKVHSANDLWNMFCTFFDHQTTFDRIIEQCNAFDVTVYVNDEHAAFKTAHKNMVMPKDDIDIENFEIAMKQEQKKEKLDINNASEVEITALPGISIVMAKKIIKKRTEINGFKNVDDVCIFLRLKPHIDKQIRELVCVKPMKGNKIIRLNTERSVDI